MRRLLVLSALLSLGAAVNASATTIAIFGNGSNTGINGGVISLAPGTGTYTLNVFGTSADLLYGIELNFLASGDVSIIAPTLAAGGDCGSQAPAFASCQVTSSSANSYGIQAAQPSGLAPGTFRLATITLNVGSGFNMFFFTGGTAVDENFASEDITPAPQLLMNVIPEPGTLVLLGTGLSVFATAGRRSS
jgi:hypothetical protein